MERKISGRERGLIAEAGFLVINFWSLRVDFSNDVYCQERDVCGTFIEEVAYFWRASAFSDEFGLKMVADLIN